MWLTVASLKGLDGHETQKMINCDTVSCFLMKGQKVQACIHKNLKKTSLGLPDFTGISKLNLEPLASSPL